MSPCDSLLILTGLAHSGKVLSNRWVSAIGSHEKLGTNRSAGFRHGAGCAEVSGFREFLRRRERRAIRGRPRAAPQFQGRRELPGNNPVSRALPEASFASPAGSRGNNGETPRQPESAPEETFCQGWVFRATLPPNARGRRRSGRN